MEKSAYNKNEGCLRGGVKFSTGGIVHEQANLPAEPVQFRHRRLQSG